MQRLPRQAAAATDRGSISGVKEKGRKGRAVEWADLTSREAGLVLGKTLFELPQHLSDPAFVALHLSWLSREGHWQTLLCTPAQTLRS